MDVRNVVKHTKTTNYIHYIPKEILIIYILEIDVCIKRWLYERIWDCIEMHFIVLKLISLSIKLFYFDKNIIEILAPTMGEMRLHITVVTIQKTKTLVTKDQHNDFQEDMRMVNYELKVTIFVIYLYIDRANNKRYTKLRSRYSTWSK